MGEATTKQRATSGAKRGEGVVTSIQNQPLPDLVDRIFEYIESEFPDMRERIAFIKKSTRDEFSGMETYIPKRATTERQEMILEVRRLFNGRNAREIARRLSISRATVYRIIKTAGQ